MLIWVSIDESKFGPSQLLWTPSSHQTKYCTKSYVEPAEIWFKAYIEWDFNVQCMQYSAAAYCKVNECTKEHEGLRLREGHKGQTWGRQSILNLLGTFSLPYWSCHSVHGPRDITGPYSCFRPTFLRSSLSIYFDVFQALEKVVDWIGNLACDLCGTCPCVVHTEVNSTL